MGLRRMLGQTSHVEEIMKLERGAVVREILRMLDEEGPMTRAEICLRLGRRKDEIAAVVTRLNKRTPVSGKRIYIKEYVYDMEGERRYPRAVYAIGPLKDAPKPKSDPKETKRRYWARSQLKLRANSVFNLGLTRSQLRANKKKDEQ